MAVLSHFYPHFTSVYLHHNNQHNNSNNPPFFSFHSTLQPKSTLFNANHSIACLAYTNKSRPSRKIMSDEELCNRLREFVASVGLPEGHVPSTKELIDHGRKDIANIIRRRGHKLIKELLANAAKPATDEYDSSEDLNEELRDSIGQKEKLTDANEDSIDVVNDKSVLGASLMTRSESDFCSDYESPSSVESTVSLQEKVEKFMKYGQLEAVDDGENLGGHAEMSVDEATPSDSILDGSCYTGSNGTLVPQTPTTEERYTSETCPPTQCQQNTDFYSEMSSETMQAKIDSEDEINRLKLMLHQKELELSRLKNEIEKEKKTLSVLQTKAEDEISKAQKLITDKEAELLAAEESLSGLVEANIYYSGDGELVEVAGSFNGWHQRIRMELQISSVTVDPADSRKSRMWSATLWLYPGVYEMKFIVDGQWRIDPHIEITIKHGVENNILRVDP